MPDASHELLKAEYERIKSEQAQRIGFRDNMLFVYLAAVGAVVGWVFTSLNPAPPTPRSPYAVYALLAIPWVSIVLGWTYVVNDHLISRAGKYVTQVLSPRAEKLSQVPLQMIEVTERDGKVFEIREFFGWEPYHKTDRRRKTRKAVQCLVDVATFIAPSVMAIVGFFYLSHWNPGTNPRTWTDADWFTGVSIVLDLLFLLLLLHSVVAYADFKRGELLAPPTSPPPPPVIPPKATKNP